MTFSSQEALQSSKEAFTSDPDYQYLKNLPGFEALIQAMGSESYGAEFLKLYTNHNLAREWMAQLVIDGQLPSHKACPDQPEDKIVNSCLSCVLPGNGKFEAVFNKRRLVGVNFTFGDLTIRSTLSTPSGFERLSTLITSNPTGETITVEYAAIDMATGELHDVAV